MCKPLQWKCWIIAWNSDGAPAGKAGSTQGSSGVCNAPEWLEGVEPGSSPSQTSFKGWWWRWGGPLLEISAYVRPSKGKRLFSFIYVFAEFGLILVFCSQRLFYPAISIITALQPCNIKMSVIGFLLYKQNWDTNWFSLHNTVCKTRALCRRSRRWNSA